MKQSRSPAVPPRKPVRSRKRFVMLVLVLAFFVLVNMLIIFMMSAESKGESGIRSTRVTTLVMKLLYPDLNKATAEVQRESMEHVGHIVRKLAHFSEFALLGFLSTGLLLYLDHRRHRLKTWQLWLIPIVFCLLYAISDEVHQIFSERGPSAWDVLVDFAGAYTGIYFMHLFRWIAHKIRARRERRAVCASPIES